MKLPGGVKGPVLFFMLTLICDSREQRVLEFKEGVFGDIIHKGLPVGDYAAQVDGQMIPLVYERKGINDLFCTMASSNYERFKREMARAKELNVKLVLLIEGSMRQVDKGNDRSQFDGDAMLKKLATLYLKYDLEYHFCVDRREMARRIEDTFSAVDRLWKKGGNIECIKMR